MRRFPVGTSVTMSAGRRLIVTADDFGYCERRNVGIVTCFQTGSVSNTSLLVNGLAAKQAADEAKRLYIPTGLHLNLTEGLPVADRDKVPSLLGSDGHFLGKHGFRNALKAGRVSVSEMLHEMEAQLEKFQSLTGQHPTHVDGHQHVHVLPAVAGPFSQVCEEYGVHWTRLPVEHDLEECSWLKEAQASFFQQVIQDALQAAPIFTSHGIRYSDAYAGLSTMGRNMTVSRLEKALTKAFNLSSAECQPLPGQGAGCLVELMVHPGYCSVAGEGGCGGGPDDFSMSEEREHEITVLQDKQLHQFFVDNEITLVSFSTADLSKV